MSVFHPAFLDHVVIIFRTGKNQRSMFHILLEASLLRSRRDPQTAKRRIWCLVGQGKSPLKKYESVGRMISQPNIFMGKCQIHGNQPFTSQPGKWWIFMDFPLESEGAGNFDASPIQGLGLVSMSRYGSHHPT